MESLSKKALSDTIHTLLPKNVSAGITKQQIVEIQIPKSEYVVNLKKAYVSVDLQMGAKISAAVSSSTDYIGILNAACIFDQISLNSGRNVFTDTFSQVNSRIWQLSKSNNYLQANPASFINYDDIKSNENLLLYPVSELKDAVGAIHFRLKIPLPCLYNCFDECEFFSTTHLNDNVTLSMTLSALNKYMCFVSTDGNRVTSIKPFESSNTVEFDFGSGKRTVTLIDTEDYYMINAIKLVTPAHYPEADERENLDAIIKNGLWYSSYRNCDVQAFKADLNKANTIGANFSTNANNIYGVFMLSSHNSSYTVFDKPDITICLLSIYSTYKIS